MKPLLLLSATALLSLDLAACGGAGKSTSPSGTFSNAPARPISRPQPKDSNDLDDDVNGNDDSLVLNYGRAASVADTRAVTSLVKRYYAASAASNGAKACSMIVSSLTETIVEENSQSLIPAHRRGETCAVVIAKLLKPHRRQLTEEEATLKVMRVGVEEGKALVVLRFAITPEPRDIAVRREDGTWKINELLDIGMP